jgi:hypothetical protein
MNIRFNANLSVFSEKGEFPPDTVAAVILTNRDGCTHKTFEADPKGRITVDYEMKPLTSNASLTDRLKLHFMFRDNADGQLKHISAGHVELGELADLVKTGDNRTFQSNFCSNTVQVNFEKDPLTRMHLEYQALQNTGGVTKSVLSDSDKHVNNMRTLDHSVRAGLQSNAEISKDNGGPMFKSMFTAHVMGGEAALYNLYHLDFQGAKNYPPWLATYMLGETLHTNGLTCEQVKALPPDQLTRFVASYAQAAMRSASATQYTADLTIDEDPKMAKTLKNTMLTEVFKAPFREPVRREPGKRRCLVDDDCEGLAAMICDSVNHLGHMHVNLQGQFTQNDNFLAYNSLRSEYFPRDLFSQMTVNQQSKLMDLAMYIGEKVHTKEIEPKITLVSANAASFGAEAGAPKEVQAHACASLVCNHPKYHAAIMLEGTACISDEVRAKKVDIGGEFVSMTDVVNTLSTQPPFNLTMSHPELNQTNVKLAMHVTHSKGSFYRTAFCQNDTLLGAQIGEAPMQFGVDMEYLSDHSIKVHMPVQGKILKDDEFEKMKAYVAARMDEIHPPLCDHCELRRDLQWTPMTLFRGHNQLDSNRPRMTAMMHVTVDPDKVESVLQTFQNEADNFNSAPVHLKLGCCRVFPSMDGVSKVLDIYSDDLTVLQQQLQPTQPKAASP